MVGDCPKPKILRLVDDVVVSSSIEIRSEKISLIGDSSRLLFQRDIEPSSAPSSWSANETSTKREPTHTPKVGNDGPSVAAFMFEVLNSTFSVSGVHAILNSKRNGICSVAGSNVHFSSSSITSTGDCSPFMVMMSGNEGTTIGSTIVLTDVIHHSSSDHVAPFVGLLHLQSPLSSSPAIEKGDAGTSQAECVTVVGTALWMDSQKLIGGTGPLFSFGVSEHDSSLSASGCTLRMETDLLSSTLVNMTCSSRISLNNQQFGSEVCQLMVGSCVDQSTNHDSGTGMMSPILGGNVMCLNTSFSSCIHERNEDLDFSFENRTQTIHGRLGSVSSDVTSVSFTLCTFNEITVAAGSNRGGGAVFLDCTASSLTVRTCFFLSCSCTATYDDGGAIYFKSLYDNKRPAVVSHSSFTDCSAGDCGGSLAVIFSVSLVVDFSFFDGSKGNSDGAALVDSSGITISNSAFVACSGSLRGGALTLFTALPLSLSFLQFRGCSSTNTQDARDIYFGHSSTQITARMIESCDSTSGLPNVFFNGDSQSSSSRVPKIDSTPSVKSVTVTVENNEATVIVQTQEAIKGTMGVLLNGSLVPRLVHVVFGEPSKESTVGTAVVSSGPNGILPSATYAPHKHSFATGLFPPPTVRTANANLKDWNTTEIVVQGVNFWEEHYWMEVERGGKKWNISLTRSDSTTLTGTAPLYPSTLEVRLEWGTEYEVTKVMWLPEGHLPEEAATLSGTVTFTTPPEPLRITSADCSLGGVQQKSAIVLLKGVKLEEGKKFNVTVQKMEGSTPSGADIVLSGTFSGSSSSTTHTHSVVIFGIPNPLLSFQTTYLITQLQVDGEISAVDAEVTFSVPPEPSRITGAGCSLNGKKDVLIVELSGSALSSSGLIAVVKGTSDEIKSSGGLFNVTSTKCFVNFSIGLSEDDSHVGSGGRYDLLSVGSEASSILVTPGLFIDVPHPPRITKLTPETAVTTSSFVLSVSGSSLPSGKKYTVILTTDDTFEMSFSSAIAGTSTILIGGNGEVQYGTEYTIRSIILKVDGKDDEHVLLSESTFKSPLGPTLSSISCDFDSSNPDFVKLTLTSTRMPSEDFTLTLKTTQLPILTVELPVTSDDISAGFVLVEVNKKTNTLKYGTGYSIVGMASSSVTAVVSALPFTTPSEPIRITSAECSLGGDKQKSAIVLLKGVKLGGDKDFNLRIRKMVGSTPIGGEIVLSGKLSGSSSSTTHAHSEVIFGIPNSLLSFQTTYLITKIDVAGEITIVNAGVNFTVPAEPARLTSLDTSLQYSSDEKTATISLSGIGMEGDYTLTFSVNSSSTDNVTLTATFDAAGRGVVSAVLFDLSDPSFVDLSYNTQYEVVGVTKASTPVWFENDMVFTTIPVPRRLLSIRTRNYVVGMDFVELSFDSISLPSETTFTLTLDSVHSDSTTPHQKVINLETDGSGELKVHSVQLYPFETETEKRKGQLEYNTEYKVVSFATGSTPIHFEDITTRLQTPMEPARIEKCTSKTLNSDRTELELSLEGRKLRANLGFLNLTTDSGSWTSIGEIEADDETHCSVRFLTAESENTTHVEFGKEYTLKKVSADESNFVVNNGITIVIPFPPKVTNLEFIFSHDLHTGCFVKLTGTDLIVGNSLKYTLNDSLSFIVTISSETVARSLELPIGWPQTLQHNTTYTITSIEAMNEADGKIHFNSALSNATGSLPKKFVVYVDSGSSSDSSVFCGDQLRPCTSIEDGWKIVEGLRISTFSISILQNTTQTEQVRILSHHQVVIESGPSTKPELFVSPSTKLVGDGMVDVSGGRLWIHQVDIALSDSPSLIFIRMVGGHLTIETCSLVGPKGTPISNIDSSSDLCEWDTGVLKLKHATTIIKQTDLTHLSHGTINMKGGNLTIEGGIFHDNNPLSSSFPSLRHNIQCSEGGEIEIGSLNGGDGVETPSAWISASDCQLAAKETISRSPFFVPTLSSSSTSTLNKTEKAFILTIEGTTLIPCSLFLEVFEKKKDGKEGYPEQFLLTQNMTSYFNDTKIVLSLPLSSLTSFDDSWEWRGRLAFGKDEISATSFLIQENVANRRSQAVKENMKWWLPLLVSLVCLLLLIIIVVFICWRRRKQTKQDTTTAQPQELTPIDEKMEVEFEDRMTMEVSTVVESTKVEKEMLKGLWGVETDMTECLHCGDVIATSYVSRKATLYEHLHREKKALHNRRQCEIQLARGLDQVARMAAFSEMLRHVTSHRILIGKDGSLNVNFEKPERSGVVREDAGKEDERSNGAGTAGASTEMGGQNGMNEAVRWQAPEEGKAHVQLDLQQVGVFRLGLVLYEIETGCVPFGETDAVNAHRQLEAGMELAMEKVENKSMAEVITSCLQVDPKLRPSFTAVASSLEGIAPDAVDNGITVVS
ncbi:hypothetical protein BLNAU_21550 [Blattamonas nauphoetae]|uniref:Protein kinase domain-containing protein n=1 Tax=Blattamonas nauphoetae TaxID=2049346 RepID=A0ABQ9WW30_9EUKA|nr:hypothetical protein BLNAU_21550 [Blattamonas nauphoetae]